MNIEEGGRRLSLVLTWLVIICICIPGAVTFIILGIQSDNIIASFLGLVFVLIIGFAIRDICHKAGMWVIKGFIDSKEDK